LHLDDTYNTNILTNNNGNVLSQRIVVGTMDVTQTYDYDELNRLQKAEEKLSNTPFTSQWKQSFTYDRFGNRQFDTGQTTPASVLGPALDFSASSNHITTASYEYDSAGNVKQEPASPNNKSYAYDGENHQVAFTFNGATTHYVYDGDGKRVMKSDNNGAIVYVYDALGRLAAEYTTAAPQNNGISYLTTDHLGSTRVVSGKDANGNAIVKARYDYLPFGEEVPTNLGGRDNAGYVADNTRQKFTGHERDPETKLDFAQARYCSSTTGRFMTPDAPFADQWENDPQSWNLYIYIRNNPLIYTDPSGLWKKVHTDQGIYYEAEEKDTLESLGKLIHVTLDTLEEAFGTERVVAGQVYDLNFTRDLPLTFAEGMSPAQREATFWKDFQPAIMSTGRPSMKGGFLSKVWAGFRNLFKSKAAIPMLTGPTAREMAREAIQLVKSLKGSPEEKAALFEQLAEQIKVKTGGSWQAARMTGTDGSSVFLGTQGETLVISPAGQIFRGKIADGVLTFNGAAPTPNYSILRLLD
jgi:RHS repeat-associated protein